MKRIICLLLITCSTFAAYADPFADQPKRPEKVIANLNAIIDLHGHKAGQSFAINRNPNTNIIESSEKIATFSCFTYDASFETIQRVSWPTSRCAIRYCTWCRAIKRYSNSK